MLSHAYSLHLEVSATEGYRCVNIGGPVEDARGNQRADLERVLDWIESQRETVRTRLNSLRASGAGTIYLSARLPIGKTHPWERLIRAIPADPNAVDVLKRKVRAFYVER